MIQNYDINLSSQPSPAAECKEFLSRATKPESDAAKERSDQRDQFVSLNLNFPSQDSMFPFLFFFFPHERSPAVMK